MSVLLATVLVAGVIGAVAILAVLALTGGDGELVLDLDVGDCFDLPDDMASATVDVYPGTGKEMCLLNGVYKDGYTAKSCKTAGGTWEASKSLVTLTGFAAPPSADGATTSVTLNDVAVECGYNAAFHRSAARGSVST